MDNEERMCMIGDGEKHYAKGLCFVHYQRLITQGADMDKVDNDNRQLSYIDVPANPEEGTNMWHMRMLAQCMDYFTPVQTEYKYLKERLEAHLRIEVEEG